MHEGLELCVGGWLCEGRCPVEGVDVWGAVK